jgi:hypothetical protein
MASRTVEQSYPSLEKISAWLKVSHSVVTHFFLGIRSTGIGAFMLGLFCCVTACNDVNPFFID